MEDYTGKYKGEQVEVALFGGEYQEGVLTAYCYVDEVAHIELNGHILVPLQNIASLHCSSRCDAQANEDWPPRGLLDDDGPNGSGPRPGRHVVRFAAARNVAKAWLLLIGVSGVLALVGWSIGGAAAPVDFRLRRSAARGRRVLDVRPRRARDGARARAADRRGAAAPLDGRAARGAGRRPEAEALPHPGRAAAARSRPGAGRRTRRSRVSSGCLRACPPAELEGVLAHELAHVKHRDVALQTAVVVLAASTIELSRIGGLLQRALLFVLGPIAAACVHVLLSPKREFEADRARRRALRLAARARRRADPARAGGGARRVPGEPGDRAALARSTHSSRKGSRRSSSRIRRSRSACAGCAGSIPRVQDGRAHEDRGGTSSPHGARRSRRSSRSAASRAACSSRRTTSTTTRASRSSRRSGRSRSCSRADGRGGMLVPRLEVEHAQANAAVTEVAHYDEYPGERHPMEALVELLDDLGIAGRSAPTTTATVGVRLPRPVARRADRVRRRRRSPTSSRTRWR